MLKVFVILLLITEVITAFDEIGITASDICHQTCNHQDSAFIDFPETIEELEKFCKSRIEFMECNLQQEEICRESKLDTRVLQMRYRIYATVREVCSEDTLLHAGVTASDICDKHCDNHDVENIQLPETNEEMQKLCNRHIEYMECEIHQEEICQKNDPKSLQMRYRVLATVREICSEDTLLHADVVDNMKCFVKHMEEIKECSSRKSLWDRVQQFAEALGEEGLKPLAKNGNITNILYPCVYLIDFYSCQSLVIERECGIVAMDTYVEIIQKIRPLEPDFASCEEVYPLLPVLIRFRKVEEKEHSVTAFFLKEKVGQIIILVRMHFHKYELGLGIKFD